MEMGFVLFNRFFNI